MGIMIHAEGADGAARKGLAELRKYVDELVAPTRQPTDEKRNLLYDGLLFHPAIREASEALYKNGHYADAIFRAFVALETLVRNKSGKKDLEGRNLMAQVFTKGSPILKLNQLADESDKNEQEGFMFIFMGVMTGIRNPKAHGNVVQNDPVRTLQYLAMADLLAQRVEESSA